MNLDFDAAWVPSELAGNALAVNGGGFVYVKDSPSIDSIGRYVTVSAWVYFDGSVVDYGTAISRQIGTTLQQYYHLALRQNETASLFITVAENANPAQPTGRKPVPQHVWTHMAGTYDGANATLYVDGAEVASMAITGDFSSDVSPLILGGNGNDNSVSEFFPGRLDEVALFNRALSADDIKQLFALAPL